MKSGNAHPRHSTWRCTRELCFISCLHAVKGVRAYCITLKKLHTSSIRVSCSTLLTVWSYTGTRLHVGAGLLNHRRYGPYHVLPCFCIGCQQMRCIIPEHHKLILNRFSPPRSCMSDVCVCVFATLHGMQGPWVHRCSPALRPRWHRASTAVKHSRWGESPFCDV